MHSFYGVFEESGQRYVYKLFVEEYLNNDTIQRRGYEIKDIKIVPTSSSGSNANASFPRPVKVSTIKSVSDLFNFVKQNDKDFNPKSVSKVVNEDGTPKVVYHGTSSENGEFYIFDYNQAKKKVGHGFKQYGKGNYFSANKPKENSIFNGRIIESYLSIKNPYYSDGQLRESLKKALGGTRTI